MRGSEEWRRNGLRLQLASRWVLPRLGLQVVKAQEDSPTPALQSRLQGLTSYLKAYSDYIVSRRGRLWIVEVKAPIVVPFANLSFGSRPVQFSQRQIQEFACSPVPVKVLLWDYGWAPVPSRLHKPVFYTLLDFGDFRPVEQLKEAVTMRLPYHPKIKRHRISPATLRRLIQRSNAEHVKEIRPGRVVRDPTV